MSDEENKPVRIATLGVGGTELSKHNVGLFASQVIQREQQVRQAEMQKRRTFIANLSDEFINHDVLEAYENLTNKELRKHSKEFSFIHFQIRSLHLSRMAKTGKGVTNQRIKQIITALSYISHSKQFSAMDMEDSTTDYFRITMALYIATKAIAPMFKANNIPDQTKQNFVFISSEIGLRIYSLYTDHRMDM